MVNILNMLKGFDWKRVNWTKVFNYGKMAMRFLGPVFRGGMARAFSYGNLLR